MRQENRELLGPLDVVLAAHPGSGASWIGPLLVHLGVFYASGHEERLVDRTSQRTERWVEDEEHRLPGLAAATPPARAAASIGIEEQHRHLPALHERDRLNPTWREPWRVIKTNQSALGWTPPGKVVLLVRDGRDTLLSLYHNLRSFSGLDVALPEFLTGNGGAWLPPARSWAACVLSWPASTPPERLHVLCFETCRQRPREEFRALLAFLGIERDDAELERAIAASSYARMRQAESAAIAEHGETIGRGRILRRGEPGEWRTVFTPEMLRTFRGLPRRALERFGYPTDGIPSS